MAHVSRGTLLAGVLALFSCLGSARPVLAQSKGESVTVTTVDDVRLHGQFFASAKKNAPVIIFLHKIGDKGVQQSYLKLASALSENYSVMVFDFRGHGKSKDVNPGFWKIPVNQSGIKGGSPKNSTIDWVSFKPNYYPALVNDIAAVKAYLDRKNDANECNTSSTILIGAESGATLGAIWLNSQWSLVRMNGNPLLPQQMVPSANTEGRDVVACIWMSIDPGLHKSFPVNLTRTLQVPVGMNACPTVFMYGDANSADKNRADALVKTFKKGNADDEKYKFIVGYPIKNTNLRGMSLNQKSTNLEVAIAGYLDQVVDKRGGEWRKRDYPMTQYMWRNGAQLVPAKLVNAQADPNNLNFDMYERFIGSGR